MNTASHFAGSERLDLATTSTLFIRDKNVRDLHRPRVLCRGRGHSAPAEIALLVVGLLIEARCRRKQALHAGAVDRPPVALLAAVADRDQDGLVLRADTV